MPQVDRLVDFAFAHQTLIIEGIFATLLGIVVVWLFINLREENDSEQTGGATNREMEVALKKILAATQNNLPQPPPTPAQKSAPATPSPAQVTPAASNVASAQGATPAKEPARPSAAPVASVAAPAPGGSTPSPVPVAVIPADPTEVNRLKSDIDSRNKKVDELEKLLAQAKNELKEMVTNNPNSALLDEFRQKVAALEGRLKEYAIIEDDIANLTMYKEENAKLKDELELLRRKNRGGGGGGGSSDPTPSNTSGPPTIPSAPEKMGAAPQQGTSPGPTPGKMVAVGGEESPSWPINEGDSKKLLQEFDSLMGTEIPAAATEILDQANAKEGEKLIADFQNFMKGTGG